MSREEKRVVPRLKLRVSCLIALVCALWLPMTTASTAGASASASGAARERSPVADTPGIEPDYIYDQLAYMATHFQRRESGYDNNLPVSVNGHDEFADYWAQEMMRDLDGFGPQVRRDEFAVQGWLGRHATVPAFNVEVSVPGVTHPEQVVVIGCHYDGEASSTQSANDDASGCAIELGVAKAMGVYWRAHHVYPGRTLRFVIFDAEEQGLFGSFHFLNETVNGDVSNITAMFNEEQNGIAYPLRFLGKAANPLLPLFVDVSPLQNNETYPSQSQLTPAQVAGITRFHAVQQQAVTAAFAQLQALGYTTLAYHGDNGQEASQPVFAPDQVGNVQVEDDALGSSDQVPFTLAGLPCATYVGNSTYYDQDPPPPPWSYPYDQPQDTIQLMNTYASGGSDKAPALVLALALPGMLTTWMLAQPDILGQAPADGKPIAAIGDIGQAQVNRPLSLDAKTAFDPAGNGSLSYTWSFGDGATAEGATVRHAYAAPGQYTLKLTVTSVGGTRIVTKTLAVAALAPTVANPYAHFQVDGTPPRNPLVTLPQPNPGNGTGNGPGPGTSVTHHGGQSSGAGLVLALLIALLVLALLVLGGVAAVFIWSSRQKVRP
jgi:hypothetical protein